VAQGGSSLRELRGAKDLLSQLTGREIHSRYRGTILGQLWGLLNPLAMMAIYTVVFSRILRVQPPAGDPSGLDVFALWILCGLLPWIFVGNCITSGLGALVGNAGLITKVWFPREVLVASVTLGWLVSFGFEMSVLLLAVTIAGNLNALLWAVAAVPVVALMLAFGTGLALTASVLNVYFRDTAQVVTIGMQVWFYATPIVYPEALVPERYQAVLGLNPMSDFVSCFRALLYDARIPDAADLLGAAAWSAAVFAFGVWLFRRFEPRLAEEL
jgi:ABC-2 type transport system permease protein